MQGFCGQLVENILRVKLYCFNLVLIYFDFCFREGLLGFRYYYIKEIIIFLKKYYLVEKYVFGLIFEIIEYYKYNAVGK